MRPQAYRPDEGPNLMALIAAVGYLIGMAFCVLVFLAAVALVMSAALDAGR